MKKNLKPIAAMILFAVFCVCACKKGEKGEQGPTGNADVTMFTFENKTFTNTLALEIPISKSRVDSSLVLVYYCPSTEAASSWYPVPGIGSSGTYNTRYNLYQPQTQTQPSKYRLDIRTLNMAGTAYGYAVTFTKIKVIFAPASSISALSNLNEIKNDYYLAEKQFNIK